MVECNYNTVLIIIIAIICTYKLNGSPCHLHFLSFEHNMRALRAYHFFLVHVVHSRFIDINSQAAGSVTRAQSEHRVNLDV